MDGRRFDDLARTLGHGKSRRGLLKALGGAALGVVGANRLAPAASAKGDKVDICHYDADEGTYHVINVSTKALQAHLNHGDVLAADAHGTTTHCTGCGDTCDEGQDCCDKGCTDLGTITNCTACGDVCRDGQACCSHGCTDLGTPDNCGACGDTCYGDVCNDSVCTDGGCVTTPKADDTTCTTEDGTGFCSSGACICVENGLVAECSTGDDCGAGETCLNGGCFAACSSPSECPPCPGCGCFNRSNGGGFCLDSTFHIGSCDSDSDCPAGSVCSGFVGGGGHHLCTRPCLS